MNKQFSDEKPQMANEVYTWKKMIHIVNSKGNASYNYLEISSHSSQNVYVHENKWQNMCQKYGEKKALFVVKNVNLCSNHEDH